MNKDLLLSLLNNPTNEYRGDCPTCGGKNTFTAARKLGVYTWNCYRQSCDERGGLKASISKEELNDIIKRPGLEDEPFVIPSGWLHIYNNQRVLNYLNKNNCLQAFKQERVDIRYDPEQDRVVFLIMENGVCYGAIGRSLNFSSSLKWYRYDMGRRYYTVFRNRNSNGVLIVEDAASATSACSIINTVALLGTSINDNVLALVGPFQYCFLALDKDATVKAINYKKKLDVVCPTSVIVLNRDIKTMTNEEIYELLYGTETAQTPAWQGSL